MSKAPEWAHLRYADCGERYRLRFQPERTPEEEARMARPQTPPPSDGAIDTSKARYVWLPFRFKGNMGVLDWRDEWSLDEYE